METPESTGDEIKAVVARQRAFFALGKTRSTASRLQALKVFEDAFRSHEQHLLDALYKDMKKPPVEAFFAELHTVYHELKTARKDLHVWAQPRPVRTPLLFFPSTGYVYPEPYGLTLTIAPWNYPVALLLNPVIGALAAGNCAVLKPSNHAPHTARVVTKMIREAFDPSYVAVVNGGRKTNQLLLAEKFDYIFFTGSPAVGKIVMEAASKHLTPITLELGGKSPAIVEHTAHLEKAARKIVWGKYYNAGQTCVAPDYLFVQEDIAEEFVGLLKKEIRRAFGDNPRSSRDFGRIINDKHTARLAELVQKSEGVVCGGEVAKEDRYIAPTIVTGVTSDSAPMQEEIFGPILPVISYETLDEVITFITARPKPLALYLYTEDACVERRIIQETSSGGVVVNDNLIHLGTSTLPFGGVGESGMGHYHGKYSFDTFSHMKSILHKSMVLDVTNRYTPYTKPLAWLRRLAAWLS